MLQTYLNIINHNRYLKINYNNFNKYSKLESININIRFKNNLNQKSSDITNLNSDTTYYFKKCYEDNNEELKRVKKI